MADNLTDAEENRLLDLSIPTDGSCYVSLFTTAPGEAGGGTEVSGGSYARQSLTVGAASGGAKANNAELLFPQATGLWGTIVAIGVHSAASAGTLRWYRVLSGAEQRTVDTGDQYRIASGGLTFSLS